ncbi:MAG: hypothetical protein ACRDHP_15145, partial [Ktedonobacterales bacterium]
GALDAHLHPDILPERVLSMTKRIRSAEIAIFSGFVIFGVGFLVLLRLRDPLATWDPAAAAHPELGWLYSTAEGAGFVGLLALLAGGVPLVLVALKRAYQARRRAVLRPLVIATAVSVAYALFTIATFLIAESRPGTGIRPLRPVDAILSLLWVLFSAVGLIVGSICVSLAVARSEVATSLVRLALIPATITTLCIAVSLGATAALTALIVNEAPGLMDSQDSGGFILACILAFMVVALVIAVAGLVRGLRANRAAGASA